MIESTLARKKMTYKINERSLKPSNNVIVSARPLLPRCLSITGDTAVGASSYFYFSVFLYTAATGDSDH
jgi:hypothetical protein